MRDRFTSLEVQESFIQIAATHCTAAIGNEKKNYVELLHLCYECSINLNSPEPKAQVRFSDQNLSVLSVVHQHQQCMSSLSLLLL